MKNLRLASAMTLGVIVLVCAEAYSQSTLTGPVREEWVRHYGSGHAPAYDEPAAIVVDNSGNIYVTGSSSGKPYGMDYLTIKYNSVGVVRWTARYDGSANGDDLASAISIDNSGNVYVTGKSWSGSSFDYATIKYDSFGVQQWERRYDGPAQGWDEATALVLDHYGSVFVTGNSMNSSDDCATIKYSNLGIERWVSRFNGDIDGSDHAAAISLDVNSNVLVVGSTTGTNTGKDFLTIKYDSTGTQRWVAVYAGPTTSTDEGTDLVVDASGNVYVTGGSGSSSDYLTIKYSPSGVEQWSNPYDGNHGNDWAVAIGLAPAENAVYVTGWSGGSINYHYATIKYDAFGQLEWEDRYGDDNFYNRDAIAKALAVGTDGNVYVTGRLNDTYVTIKYTSSGQRLWISQFENVGNYYNYYNRPTSIAVDDSANVYVAGLDLEPTTLEDYVTIKYNAAGIKQWAMHYNGPGNSHENATSLALDINGNICVAGYGDSLGSSSDYLATKYNFTGFSEWAVRYNDPVNEFDRANAIATDGAGNVYLTGTSNKDFATIKYDPVGQRQWVIPYNGPGNSTDEATAVALDNAGNVHVTGKSVGSGGSWDFLTIKYDKSRSVIWNKRFDGVTKGSDEAVAIVVDDSFYVYITGKSQRGPYDYDYVTIKYDSLGNEKWVRYCQSPEGRSNAPTAMEIDKSRNVYVTGTSGGSFLTVKYDTDGEEQWRAEHVGRIDQPRDLAVDGVGSVYVVGRVGEWPDYHYATIKYDHLGTEQWVKFYDGIENDVDDPKAITIDFMGNVYVTGRSKGLNSDYDFATIKYDPEGNEQWVARYDGPRNTFSTADEPAAIAVDYDGNVFVGGTSSSISFHGIFETIRFWNVFAVVKYTQIQEDLPPAPPQNLRAVPGDQQVALTWDVNSEPDVLRYRIYLGTSSNSIAQIDSVEGPLTTNKIIGGLMNGIMYYFRITAVDARMHESGFSNEAIATPELQIVLAIHDTSAAPGDTVAIPLKITDASRIAGAQIAITYDPQALTALDAKQTALTRDFLLQRSFSLGKIAIALASDSSITGGSGDFLLVNFRVNPTATIGSITTLAFDTLAVFDEDTNPILVQGINGKFTVVGETNVQRISVSPDTAFVEKDSTKIFTVQGRDAANNIVAISAAWEVTGGIGTLEPLNGDTVRFEATNLGDGVIRARFSALKDTSHISVGLRGDINRDGIIDVRDAIICLRIISGLDVPVPQPHSPPTPFELWLADANRDGNREENDALLILSLALGRLFPKSNLVASDEEAVVRFPEFAAQTGEIVTIPISVERRSDIFAAGFTFKYDPETLTVVEADACISNALKSENSKLAGKTRLSLISVDGLIGSNGEIARLKLKAAKTIPAGAHLSFERVRLFDAQGEPISVRTVATGIANETPLPTSFALFQNYPNPFNPETAIRFQLPQESHVLLSIYNLQGQLLRTLADQRMKAGDWVRNWDGRDGAGNEVPSGMYFYRLQIDGNKWSKTRKMILMR